MIPSKKIKRQQLTNEEMESLLSESYKPGNWIQVPKPFLDILSMQEALFLCYLRGYGCKVRPDVGGNGWFYCTMSTIERELRISVDTQKRLMRKLVEREYVFTRWQKGKVPARRLIKINWKVIAEDLYDNYEERSEKEFRDDLPNHQKSRLQLIQEMEELEDSESEE